MTRRGRTMPGPGLAVAVLAASGLLGGMMPVAAQDVVPGLVYSTGGKFDRGFNESAFNGAEAFEEETGVEYLENEPGDSIDPQDYQVLIDQGATMIVGIGFDQVEAVEQVAADNPEVNFTIIDSVVEAPNVQSIVFKEHEGSFLAGALAALASEAGTIGFIGGIDVPLIRKFSCGYKQGAAEIDDAVDVLTGFVGGFADQDGGASLAAEQFDNGADVIFAAAGGSGLGVYDEASQRGQFAIGVDTNQNYLYPGTMLTSMVKRVDRATQEAMTAAVEGTWSAGVTSLGLAENGVGLAFDEFNSFLVTDEQRSRIDALRSRIVDGSLDVVDYTANGNSCPS
jgi:basic membrane protein A